MFERAALCRLEAARGALNTARVDALKSALKLADYIQGLKLKSTMINYSNYGGDRVLIQQCKHWQR